MVTEDWRAAPKLLPYGSNKRPSDAQISIQIASEHARLVNIPKPRHRLGRSTDLERVKSTMEVLGRRCILCWMKGMVDGNDHLLGVCTKGPWASAVRNGELGLWRKGLQFPDGICFGCGCPQHVSRVHIEGVSDLLTNDFS